MPKILNLISPVTITDDLTSTVTITNNLT
jgi:hypothetical protein